MDDMLSVSNTDNQGNSRAVSQGGMTVKGATSTVAYSLWCATAREIGPNVTPVSVDKADRTATTCYMRGLRENIRIQSSSGLPWLWRRICFLTKSDLFTQNVPGDQNPTQPFSPYALNGASGGGYARQWFNLLVNNTPNTVDIFNALIFQGQQNKDWDDVITAKLDSTRIVPVYDKVITLRTGNANGYFKDMRMWFPMNKNLVYDDDEEGTITDASAFSTTGLQGMGNYYVLDIVTPGLGGTNADLVNFRSQATLYWHEK